MSNRGKVVVEFEVENETLQRGFQISQANPEIWDFFEDILDLIDLANSPKGVGGVDGYQPELGYLVERTGEGNSVYDKLNEEYGFFED